MERAIGLIQNGVSGVFICGCGFEFRLFVVDLV